MDPDGKELRKKAYRALGSYNEALFLTHHTEDPGAGLRNLGKTRFMNSGLQCLVHTVAILSENRSSTAGRGDFAPMGLANSLKYISATHSKGQQGDAHEFLTMLWTRIEECHVKSQYESLRVFGGVVLVKNTVNLVDTEAKVGNSSEKCGKGEGAAIQKVMLHEFPSIATFQLKRFDNKMKRIEKDVSFPLVLNNMLPLTTAAYSEMCYGQRSGHNKMNYELFAGIVHEGSTLMAGYYHCSIHLFPDEWGTHVPDSVGYTLLLGKQSSLLGKRNYETGSSSGQSKKSRGSAREDEPDDRDDKGGDEDGGGGGEDPPDEPNGGGFPDETSVDKPIINGNVWFIPDEATPLFTPARLNGSFSMTYVVENEADREYEQMAVERGVRFHPTTGHRMLLYYMDGEWEQFLVDMNIDEEHESVVVRFTRLHQELTFRIIERIAI